MSRHRRQRPAVPSVRPDYLRALGGDVDAGLDLVVHDLTATGALTRADAEAAVRVRAAEHLAFLTDNALDVSAADVAVRVAEAVQEDLVEGSGARNPSVIWPRCPEHPNHPLWLRRGGQASEAVHDTTSDEAWTCPTTHRALAELGRL